jgi:hypothetical protein
LRQAAQGHVADGLEVRGLARALDDMLNPDGSWARRTVYHSFRLLHPYQWSHRF